MCTAMNENGALGILHRFCSIEQQQQFGKSIKGIYGAAIGVCGDYLERYEAVAEAGATIICIDIACGHHILMQKAIEKINVSKYRDKIHLMAGNVATGDGFVWLAQQNVDSVRVGIGRPVAYAKQELTVEWVFLMLLQY